MGCSLLKSIGQALVGEANYAHRAELLPPSVDACNRGAVIRSEALCCAILCRATTAANANLCLCVRQIVDYSQLVQKPVEYAGLFTRFLSLDPVLSDLLEQHMVKSMPSVCRDLFELLASRCSPWGSVVVVLLWCCG